MLDLLSPPLRNPRSSAISASMRGRSRETRILEVERLLQRIAGPSDTAPTGLPDGLTRMLNGWLRAAGETAEQAPPCRTRNHKDQ